MIFRYFPNLLFVVLLQHGWHHKIMNNIVLGNRGQVKMREMG